VSCFEMNGESKQLSASLIARDRVTAHTHTNSAPYLVGARP
jgi:hypothetical protein